jgi:AcrR family transcriptional regulator
MRKKPKQRRAEATVTAILDTAAQLLEEGGGREISTNHIAERAGVSIGTLYQYFSDKDEVLRRLAHREFGEIAGETIEQLDRLEIGSAGKTSRAIVRLLVDRFSNEHMLRRLSSLTIAQRLQSGGEEPLMKEVAAAVANKLGLIKPISLEQSRVYSFIITRAVLGVVRAAMISDIEMMKSKEFEDQLTTLMISFIEGS